MANDPEIIVDAHEDIALNVAAFGRDFTGSAYQQRQIEQKSGLSQKYGLATLGLPNALLGRVGLIFGTIFVAPAWSPTTYGVEYETPVEAYKKALQQIDVYHRLAESNERISLVRTQSELANVLSSWADNVTFEKHRLGIVIAMEGADPIREPKAFEEWYERGVRVVGLAWSQTRYSGGTHRPGSLTSLGRELLDIMESLNAILDLSHMAEESYLQAIEQYGGQIIASHSNPRKFCNTDRHLSDGMIRQLAERGGVMGIVPYNAFLHHNWTATDKKEKTTLMHVIAAIDHVCQLTGSAQHVGIGSDFDGGFGAEAIPKEFDTVTDLYIIGPALAERGYSSDDIRSILGGNFLRILRAALPK